MNTGLIGEIFIKERLIGGDKLEEALGEQAKTGQILGKVLVALGLISDNDVIRALSIQTGLPVLKPHEHPQTPLPAEGQLSLKFLKHYKVVPVGLAGKTLNVATSNPFDPFPLEAIRNSTGLRVEATLSSEKDILGIIESLYGGGTATVGKIIEGMDGKDNEEASYETDDVEHLKDIAHEAPVINLVNLLITRAVEKKASDVHIEPYGEILHVRYRVDGILAIAESLPKKLHPAVASRVKIMAKLNIAERRLPQDGRIRMNASGKEMDIRVSTVPTLYGESIVMRLLDPTGVISLDSVGFCGEKESAFAGLITQPHGMILVTGPTGSGKSTTLYAALSRIDTIEKKVITIEDPVEYNLEGVNQIQVKPKIGFTFANGLRSIVRQDPDVIMVGEIRDTETANIAVHSALTGHLILSTLHTNDAPGAVTRLIDMGVESYLISSCLMGVLAQRLVRVICPDCKTAYVPQSGEIANMREELSRIEAADHGGELKLFKGAGCAACDNTGYRGRTGIFELMKISDSIRQMIVEKKNSNALRLKAIEEGMVPLRVDGLRKALKGVTTIDEVSRVTIE